jgi:hypothetical protein
MADAEGNGWPASAETSDFGRINRRAYLADDDGVAVQLQLGRWPIPVSGLPATRLPERNKAQQRSQDSRVLLSAGKHAGTSDRCLIWP